MWQITGEQASLGRSRTHLHCSLIKPAAGLLVSAFGAVGATPLNLFQIARRHGEPTMKLVEAYDRGTDLIANFEPTPPDEVQPQILWRICADEATHSEGVELVISMQTNLLHSDPLLSVTSELPPGKFFTVRDQKWQGLNEPTLAANRGDWGLLLHRPWQGNWSYLEAIFPSDFIAASPSAAKRTGQVWSQLLFGEPLEKGVIRRARLIGWVMPRENDFATAFKLWQAFYASPPPLTS